jgi:phosphoglycerate dehydrogenase-like enzyme
VIRVVIAVPDAGLGVDTIREHGVHADIVIGTSDELPALLVDADAIVCMRLTAADTKRASSLRLVQVFGAGDDEIAPDALPPGCVLANVYEHGRSIAEWALMVMLALSRRLLVHDRHLRQGIWHESVHALPVSERDLESRTVGAIGFGHIGRHLAELARALGMRVIAVTRSPSDARAGLQHVAWLRGLDALPELLVEADFAVVCLPLVGETRGLIGERELELLGPESYLLNVARGPIVDETALYKALRDGTIAGAALDVWYRYPSRIGEETLPATQAFWELDNVLMTPHSSGWVDVTLPRRWRFVASQLERLAKGRPLENVLRVG